MFNIQNVLLLAAMLVYIIFVIYSLNRWDIQRRMDIIVDDGRTEGMKLMFYEHMLIDKIHIEPEKIRFFIYGERIALGILVTVCAIAIRGLTILLFGAVLIIIMADQGYKTVIYNSGITNIPNVVNFINYFVPHINSGNSADQSLLGYIDYSQDPDLAEFYEHRDDPTFKLQPHIRQIVDIYDIAKYNEEKGISNYSYILNEISKDYAQKQIYYNSFVARIGEIKPIMLSYYFGVPILIITSFRQTYNFWMGWGGVIVAILVLVLFATFKYLIFKLQKDTVTNIF